MVNKLTAGAGTEDCIDLSSQGISFEWLMAHASDVDGTTVLISSMLLQTSPCKRQGRQ